MNVEVILGQIGMWILVIGNLILLIILLIKDSKKKDSSELETCNSSDKQQMCLAETEDKTEDSEDVSLIEVLKDIKRHREIS